MSAATRTPGFLTTADKPLRFPDVSSTAFMTRRGWWLLVINFLIPGSAQSLAGSKRLGRFGLGATLVLWGLAVVALIVFLTVPTVIYTIATTDITMLAVQVLLVAYGILWLVLTLDTLRLIRVVKVRPKARAIMAALSAVLLAASLGTAGYATYVVGISRGLLGDVFGNGQVAEPIDGRYNIMLLGGDAGSDREGLRPDSISVVSIDADTGAATIIGLPRDLQNIPFPEDSPMYELYPDGYTADNCDVDVCMLNSIYTEVEVKDDGDTLYPDAEANGSQPGIEAMRDAVSGILDLPIQYFVLVDMQGFTDLIDALGGITITWGGDYDLPLGGVMVDGELTGVNMWIAPGTYEWSGERALAYARSRYGDSDYERMKRQRQVQEAILKQFEPANVLAKFQDIAAAGSQVVKTDVPQGTLGYFVQLALKTKELPIATIEVAPPLIESDDPDYDLIHSTVHQALFPDATDAPADE